MPNSKPPEACFKCGHCQGNIIGVQFVLDTYKLMSPARRNSRVKFSPCEYGVIERIHSRIGLYEIMVLFGGGSKYFKNRGLRDTIWMKRKKIILYFQELISELRDVTQ